MVIFLAYLIGSISAGYLLVFFIKGEDIRDYFSGSTGGRNVGRILGKTGFFATAVGDIGKGVIALVIAQKFSNSELVILLSLIFVIVGHIWPVFLNFRGGKGLSAALGAILVYDYQIAVIYFSVATVLAEFTKRITLSGLLSVALLPMYTFALGYSDLPPPTPPAGKDSFHYPHRRSRRSAASSGPSLQPAFPLG